MTHIKFNNKPSNRNFNTMVDDFFTDLPVFVNRELSTAAAVNITGTDKNYRLEIAAPGFEKADFKVNLDQGILTISAEKKEESKEENEKAIRREFRQRSFKRSFTLDEKVDATAIEANYVNGILTLMLPKKEVVKPAATEIIIK
ncbi:MAG TPA: Hsp20/alpha crystallin family protein [Chitinophagaceae bacterium]|nr:Hsp20/alpha crystallin family protein [Chitinophagaceae bacterium]